MRKILILVTCCFLLGFSNRVHALEILYNDLSGGGINAIQMSAFNEAASYWESIFVDNVTVRVDIDMQALGTGIIGSAQSYKVDTYYGDIRNALAGDVRSTDDILATGNLQTTDHLNVVVNDLYDDNHAWILNSSSTVEVNSELWVNRANLKALSLLNDDGQADASVLMSSNFSFDYDRSDGIDSDKLDFAGVMVHEIGHALGFVSGVDIMDYYGLDGPGNGSWDWGWSGEGASNTLEDEGYFSVLDLFRYSDYINEYESGSLFGYLDWTYESVEGGWGDSYFSFDGGTTNLAPFSTGRYNGDGYQASHWEDDLGLGRMDPTTAYGEYYDFLTPLDLRAFDVIGWDLSVADPVPEPTTLLLLGAGLSGLIYVRSRKKRK